MSSVIVILCVAVPQMALLPLLPHLTDVPGLQKEKTIAANSLFIVLLCLYI